MTKLKHLVLFQLLPEADDDDVASLIDELQALAQVPEVRNLTAGRDVSGRSDYHLALACEFDGLEDLRRYLDHPAHVRITERLPRLVRQPWQVVDYWTTSAADGGVDATRA